ncbi:MAG: alcohol dehydrogenase catalytic domain-containing protein [Immundisolibacter sp.]|uniref:alcohol dehydrogenase catalytic domain-containing protein n=1 Tax=Immundisolibacter sp. TaxID=1934948 RepID=UPI003EE02AF7
MLAARVAAPGALFTLEDLPPPTPGPHEVLIRVAACGICASDLHLVDGQTPPPGVVFPLTPGHEVAGEVVEVGVAVRDITPGARVAVHPNLPCGRCEPCLRGADNLCLEPQVMGYHRLGGYCEYTTAPAHALLRCANPALAWEQMAIVPDAVSTPYHALHVRGGLRSGEQVAVYGLGGLGAHALLLARHLGAARVIAVVRRPESAALAESFGATDVVLTGAGNPVRAIRDLTGGGADLAVDFTGATDSIAAAAASLRPGGRAVLVGMSEDKLALMSAVRFARYEIALLGSYTSTLAEAQTVLDLVASGALDLTGSVTHRYPLSAVNAAYADLRARAGNPVRAVLLP